MAIILHGIQNNTKRPKQRRVIQIVSYFSQLQSFRCVTEMTNDLMLWYEKDSSYGLPS